MATALDKITYEDLYARWEKGNWRAMEIDFSEDRRQWHEVFGDVERRAALWNYSLFFHGEDSVADNLSPYIDAAPTEEQTYFLTTQQVDEARHTVFFKRFMHEVVGKGSDSTDSVLAATADQLTWGHREVFGNVSLDEQRHIAFGVRLLADLYRADPEPVQDAIVSMIREVLPSTTA